MRRILFLFFLLNQSTANAQNISGVIMDSLSQEPLVSATIVSMPSEQVSLSNEDGFFRILPKNGDSLVVVSYVGYESCQIPLETLSSRHLKLSLKSNTTLQTIEVIEQRLTKQIRDIGIVRTDVESLKQMPALLGGTDILKSLHFHMGISGGGEGTSVVNVRGGTHDQNLFLLDDVPIYNTNHAFGFLSAINADVIKSVEVYKGGIPAQYGGRLSSVISMISKEGNYQNHKAELSLGLLLSSLKVEGPILKDKTTNMAAARISYSDIVGTIAKSQYNNGARENYSAYQMLDYNLRLTHRFDDRSKLWITAYQSFDTDVQNSRPAGSNLESIISTNWRNNNAVLNYSKPIGGNGFLRAKAYYSNYEYNIQNDFTENDDGLTFKESSSISDLATAVSYDWSTNENTKWKLGIEAHDYQLAPQSVKRSDIEESLANEENINEFSLFAQYSITHFLKSRINADLGLRLIHLNNGDNLIEPRLSFSGELSSNLGWKTSFNINHQYLHELLRYVSVSFVQYWVPGTAFGSIPRSSQVDGGLTYAIDRGSQMDFEIYYKQYKNLIELRPGVDQVFSEESKWQDQYVSDGTGYAYGFGLSYKRDGDILDWQINYNYSHSTRTFDEINGGESFEANFNKRHEIKGSAHFQLDKEDRWNLNITAVYQSGRPFSLANQLYRDPYFSRIEFRNKINSRKLPSYKRIDISATKNWHSASDLKRSLSFGFYNVSGSKNYYFAETRLFTTNTSVFDPNTGQFVSNTTIDNYLGVEGSAFFQFIPYINFNLELW